MCHIRGAHGSHRGDPVRQVAVAATILAAVVLSGAGALAQAPGLSGSGSIPSPRGAAPSQQPQSPLPVVAGQMRTVAQALRNAGTQVTMDRPPNLAMARSAVSAGQAVIEDVPEQTPSGAARDAARMSLTRVEDLLARPDPAPVDVAQQLTVAADAMDNLAARLIGNVAGREGSQTVPAR